MFSAAFYGARWGVPRQNGMGCSNWMKFIISKFQWQNNSALNNGLKFFLLQPIAKKKVYEFILLLRVIALSSWLSFMEYQPL